MSLLAAAFFADQYRNALTDQQLADQRRCSLDNLAWLRLCRMPTTQQEIAQVAAHSQADADILASISLELRIDIDLHRLQVIQLP